MTPSKTIAAPGITGSLPKWMLNLPMETLGELVVPLAMLAIVVALITPLPGFILDLLIVIDILVGDRTDGVPVFATRGIHLVPHHPVVVDAVPSGVEHLQFAPDSDQRQHRDIGRRRGDRSLR
jgi:hypothetical protein